MRTSRVAKELNPFLKRRMAAYALAGAASLAVSTAKDADAEIVYTSVKQFGEGHVYMPSSVSIDLNHDGVSDFVLVGSVFPSSFSFGTFSLVFVRAEAGDGDGVAISPTDDLAASALTAGEKIGLNRVFSQGCIGCFLAFFVSSAGGPRSVTGGFYNKRNKFLGLKFVLDGSTYYGWARVNVRSVVGQRTPPPNRTFVFELVDYAYQDTPNTPIRAGEGIPQGGVAVAQSDSEQAEFPATLGLLAYGSDAIPAWRSGR